MISAVIFLVQRMMFVTVFTSEIHGFRHKSAAYLKNHCRSRLTSRFTFFVNSVNS